MMSASRLRKCVHVCVCVVLNSQTLLLSYEESKEKGIKGYEEDFLQCLERIIRDLDRRIIRGKERLKRSADAKRKVCVCVCLYTHVPMYV